jgi:hypothetical protein
MIRRDMHGSVVRLPVPADDTAELVNNDQLTLVIGDEERRARLRFDTWEEEQERAHGELNLAFRRAELRTELRTERQGEMNGWLAIAAKAVGLLGAVVTVAVTTTGGTVAGLPPSLLAIGGAAAGGSLGTVIASRTHGAWRDRRPD